MILAQAEARVLLLSCELGKAAAVPVLVLQDPVIQVISQLAFPYRGQLWWGPGAAGSPLCPRDVWLAKSSLVVYIMWPNRPGAPRPLSKPCSAPSPSTGISFRAARGQGQ